MKEHYTISLNRSAFDDFRARCDRDGISMAYAVTQLVASALDDETIAQDVVERSRALKESKCR